MYHEIAVRSEDCLHRPADRAVRGAAVVFRFFPKRAVSISSTGRSVPGLGVQTNVHSCILPPMARVDRQQTLPNASARQRREEERIREEQPRIAHLCVGRRRALRARCFRVERGQVKVHLICSFRGCACR